MKPVESKTGGGGGGSEGLQELKAKIASSDGNMAPLMQLPAKGACSQRCGCANGLMG